MDIAQIDENFKLPSPNGETDIEWLNANQAPFDLRGVFYSEEEKLYRRLPKDVADATNVGVAGLSKHTAGGRVRFITNSPYVAIKCVIPANLPMNHMPLSGSHGFSIYADGKFAGFFPPNIADIAKATTATIAFQGIRYFPLHLLQDMCIYFPLYNGVCELYIGIKKGSTVQTPTPYPMEKPVVFYGSSITQGGCTSRPGNDYVALLSRKFHFDFINLGFSGSAKGEQIMADYIAGLHPAVFVLDYDHNAPNVEHLQQTHYTMYYTFRKENPNVPIVMATKPDFDNDPNAAKRRAIVYETYAKAKKNGDKLVYFVDGEKLFQTDGRDGCTVDGCHPNDLGFYRMADTIAPTLQKALKKAYKKNK